MSELIAETNIEDGILQLKLDEKVVMQNNDSYYPFIVSRFFRGDYEDSEIKILNGRN